MIIIYFFPLIGALVAYIIAQLSIKQFIKYQPTSRTTLSGIMQKNRLAIIEDLSTMAAEKIIIEEVVDDWLDESKKNKIAKDVNQLASTYIEGTLPKKFPMITMFGGDKITDTLKDVVSKEINTALVDIGPKAGAYAAKQVDIKNLIETQLQEVEIEEIHSFIVKLLRKQVLNIITLFVITGFLIGMTFMIISAFIIA